MTFKTLSLTLSALLLSSASILTIAADDYPKPAADQGTSMPQPDKAATDQAAKPATDQAAKPATDQAAKPATDQAAKPATDQAATPDKDATAQMKSLDPDSDGTVDKAEAGKMKGLTEVFDAADKNKDGKLDTGELATAMAQIKK